MARKLHGKELALIPLFERFISDSEKGRRRQPNGKKIAAGTVNNYRFALKLLQSFAACKGITLRLRPMRHLTHRQAITEKNYWNKFYHRFTEYLYRDCGHFDNYTGQTIKILKVFFNYLNKDLVLGIGDFHKQFYVRKEEIPIFPLLPEELNFLVNDKAFEQSLDKRMREVKDFFVFGCTVALRCSDLFRLRPQQLRWVNSSCYLAVRSLKTSTDTLVKLPAYAVEIAERYRRTKKLLPHFNLSNLNKYIKQLLELAGFTAPVFVTRERNGCSVRMGKPGRAAGVLRFCDVASTHSMRRTAITTMLCLGMPEQLVRRISGHAPGGKEFYRYVQWAQTYQDMEIEKMHERLQEKKLSMP